MQRNLEILIIIFILIILLLFVLIFVFNDNKPPPTMTPYTLLTEAVTPDPTPVVLSNYFDNMAFTFKGTSKETFWNVSFENGYPYTVFPKAGTYNVQLNFTLLHSNFTGQDFGAYFMWATTPLAQSTTPTETSTNVTTTQPKDNTIKLTGPEIATYSVITWCNGNEGKYAYTYRLQSKEAELYSYKCPLIMITYPCKSASDNRCYSNYYTFTCTIIADTNTRYYPLFAVNNGSTFDGLGNIFVQDTL